MTSELFAADPYEELVAREEQPDEAELESRRRVEAIKDALRTMTRSERRLILACDGLGRPLSAVARNLGITRVQAMRQLAAARTRLASADRGGRGQGG